MKPEVIVRVPFPPESIALVEEDFVVRYAPSLPELEDMISRLGQNIRAVITNGSIGLSGDQIRALPKLEFIHTVGVGFEMIDPAAVREKGIVVCNNAGTNATSVAEQVFTLIFAVLADVIGKDRAARDGIWEEARQPRPLLMRKKVGILGLGEVGLAVARRAEAFDATVVYHNRNKRTDVPYEYLSSALALAEVCDIFVICTPGGPETKALVNADVLKAIGPKGYLINVGRGSVVENDVLVAALRNDTIAGAGIDVWTGEPVLPQSLIDAPRLVVSPHIGGRSPEAVVAAREQIFENLKAHFAGRPLRHRVL